MTQATVPTLAALREARAARGATLRRRWVLIGVTMVAALAAAIVRSHPRPGIHGGPLAITVAGWCLVASLAALIVLASRLFRPAAPRLPAPRPAALCVQPLLLVLLVASSVALEWLQSSGAGTVGLYAVVGITARAYPRRVSAAVFGVCLAYFLALAVLVQGVGDGNRNGLPVLTDVVGVIAVYLMSLFVGRIRLQEQLEERILAELEQSRAAELRGAALAERQRLAREMHDVLAHSLSGLVVQLEGARMLAVTAPGDPRLPGAVDRAHQLAKSGLDEARQAIGMLRDDELPGPGGIAALAGAFTADTGIPCQFTQAGPPRELSSAVRLALYRVTQEALTNVRKHARPDEVNVRLEYRPEAVSLTVEDAGAHPVRADAPAGAAVGAPAGAAAMPGGYGLTGMRERAGLLGGELDAGPTEAGFRVRLVVPA